MQEYIHHEPLTYDFLDPYIHLFEHEIGNGIFGDLDPYPEAQVWLTNLLEDDRFEVYFITARGTEHNINWTKKMKYQVKKDTYEWMAKYFPNHNSDNIYFTHKKDELIYELGLKMFVEDRKDTAERVSKLCKSFLITRSWNTGELNQDCRRIGSLTDLDLYLDKLLED